MQVVTHYTFSCLAKMSYKHRTNLLFLFMQKHLNKLSSLLFDYSKLKNVFFSRVKQDLLAPLDLL